MSGWIKLEKELREDRRFVRMVDALLARNAQSVTSVTQMRLLERNAVTQVLGGLAQLWMFADSHIRQDDTLDITLDEIDQLVGIEGFAKLMPSDWLEVLDENRVRLPDFQAHNGTDAKKKALTSKRVQRHRIRTAVSEVTPEKRTSVTPALPDQTRPDQKRLEETRPEKNSQSAKTVDPDLDPRNQDAWLECKSAYPPHTHGEHHWLNAERDACQRVEEGERWSVIKAGCERLYAQQLAKGNIGKEFVPSPAEFFSRRLKRYLEPFPIPISKADQRLAGNLSAADEFMRRTEVLR